jgi:protoporphyrinogen oxidase
MTVGILGGGISGVALQRFLARPSEVLEADDRPGGLCRTFWKDGFGYDIGGHILFSKHEEINQLVDRVLDRNLNHCRRANAVLYRGRYVKYPFENDLAALEKQDCYECLIGYLKADFPKPANFEEWMYYSFGQGIAEKYLVPYNRKIWKTEPREMGVEWVERIPRPPVEDVVRSALGIATEGYVHQLFFRYPLAGGIEALVQALIAPEAKISCGFRVREVRRRPDGWHVSDGRQSRRFDDVVLAMPIHEAVGCFADVPAEVRGAVAGLRHNAIYIVLLAVNNPSLMDRSAIYIPDPEVLPHRVCYMGFFSPHMVRPGASSLIAEVTCRPGDATDAMGGAGVLERTVRDLDRTGILRAGDLIATDVRRVEYAYPVYDLEYARNARTMREYFASIGVHLLGRFAQYDYINSDECLRRALALAQRLNHDGGAGCQPA